MSDLCVAGKLLFQPLEVNNTKPVSFQIDALLGSFCLDLGISMSDAISGIERMNSISDLKEVFQVGIPPTSLLNPPPDLGQITSCKYFLNHWKHIF